MNCTLDHIGYITDEDNHTLINALYDMKERGLLVISERK